MRTFNITHAQAENLSKILNLFNDYRTQRIDEGSLVMDDVTLVWNKDVIHLTFIDQVQNKDPEEE